MEDGRSEADESAPGQAEVVSQAGAATRRLHAAREIAPRAKRPRRALKWIFMMNASFRERFANLSNQSPLSGSTAYPDSLGAAVCSMTYSYTSQSTRSEVTRDRVAVSVERLPHSGVAG